MTAGWLAISIPCRASTPPNIVLMVTDDQGLQAGCYGDKLAPTPNLDRLAAQGTRFNFAYCTTSSCSPSRSVILTGLYNHANGQYGLQHDGHNFTTHAWVRSLPLLLHDAGYVTCSIGKFHVQPEAVYHFDQYANQGGQGTARMIANAEQFIGEKRDAPFFLYFCTHEPHLRPAGSAIRINARRWCRSTPPPRSRFLRGCRTMTRCAKTFRNSTKRAVRRPALGGLLEALDKGGHLNDTVIIYISDNGPPFPGAKTTLYEPGVHLPMVVRLPQGGERGIACDALVTWADITPTLLELHRPPSPPATHCTAGRSFRSSSRKSPPAGTKSTSRTRSTR